MNQKVMVSSVLTTAEFGVEGAVRLVSTVVLTRLLAPEDFGAYAVVLFILQLLIMLTDLGLRAIVLTREEEVEVDFLRTCWTIQLIQGALLAAAITAIGLALAGAQSAGWMDEASSYADPDLPWVLCAASGLLLVKSLESPKPFLYERDMRFTRLFYVRVSLAVLQTLLTIGFVIWLGNLWALLFGQIAATVVQILASFLLFRGPAMRPRLQPEAVQVILSRGKWIMSHSGLAVITGVADRVMFSLFLTAGEFGAYHIARQICLILFRFAEGLSGRFGLQYFTHLHAHYSPAGVAREYYRYRLAFDAAIAGAGGFLFGVAPLMVGILYDDRYEGVAPLLQLLALGLPLVGVGFIRAAFSAQRRFRAMTFMSLVQTGSIWLGLVLALPVLGSPSLAVAVVALHRLPELAVLLWRARREGWVRFRREARVIPLFAIGVGLGWIAEVAWEALGFPAP